MKSLTDTAKEFFALLKQMKPHQQLSLIVLGLAVLAPFIYLSMRTQEEGLDPLQWGAAFDREVLMQAEQVLVDRGYKDFKTVGQRILAPKNKVEEYNAALVAGGIWSPHARSEWEKAFEKLSVFTPKDQLEEMRDIHLRKDIRRILREIDGVQDAEVVWARSKSRSRFSNGNTVTATVNVTPRGGRELSNNLAEALRAAVVGMVPDLKRDGVTVIDRTSGRHFTGSDPNDPFDSKIREYKEGFLRDYQSRISGALSYISNVVVTVNADFDNLRSSRERKQLIDPKTVELSTVTKKRTSSNTEATPSGVPGTTSNQPRDLNTAQSGRQSTENDTENVTQSAASVTVTENEYLAATPKSVRVSVSVPEDYFEKVALREGAKLGDSDQEKADFRKVVETVRTREIAKVKQSVVTLLPSSTAPEAVTVSSHTPIPPDIAPSELPVTETLKDMLADWGGTIGLAVFAAWALLMLKKSMPSPAPQTGGSIDSLVKAMKPEPPPQPVAVAQAAPVEDTTPKTPRDRLQTVVKDDPVAAAAMITKWLSRAAS